MKIDQCAFNQIAATLARHFDSLFYVDLETGQYKEFVPTRMLDETHIPREGDDFFSLSQKNAHKYVHPDDLELVMRIHDKKTVKENLSRSNSYSVTCRLVFGERIVHVRHINVLCEDKQHVLFCMENIDAEVREKEEQRKNLQSAQRMARIDELTGIRNKNAFVECSENYDKRIRSFDKDLEFGLVMCDVNDLKRLNDTRGHSFGDEILRRASRMISNTFPNSRVYRIGGDEFVVVLSGEDFTIREELIENLKRESYANGRSRSGPVVACGMSVFDPAEDVRFEDVFKRADALMYEDKRALKAAEGSSVNSNHEATKTEIPIPEDRRQKLDALFGALFTMAGDGYVFINDLRYDYSRWALSLVDDFDMPSEYMYHAGKLWQKCVHPDDLEAYKKVVDSVVSGEDDMQYLRYRAKKPDGTYVVVQPRAFVMNDAQGNPEYFGGIIVPV